ncbi:Cathepsin L-like [Dirofilaria immitis]
MLRFIALLAILTFLIDFTVSFNDEILQLKEVLGMFDEDYRLGNMTRLTFDFQNALKDYGDGENSYKLTAVQSFLKKLEENGEEQAMKKLETEWQEYLTALGKEYDSEENKLRMAIFESNELMTEALNRKYEQGLISFKTALNDMADLTDQEFNLMNGLLLHNETSHTRRYARQVSGEFLKYNKSTKLPKYVDWRKKGYVTPAKEQGLCGSCYAFAAAAALEAYNKKTKNKLLDLSPQNILDCTWDLGNNGCHGGFMNPAFYYASKAGIASEAKYPYVHTARRTCYWRKDIVAATDNGYTRIQQGDEKGLQYAVAKFGPVVVGISGYQHDFKFYKSGVYSSDQCRVPNHAVLVVGYGTSKKHGDYWIIKNSWGTNWGRNGYVLILTLLIVVDPQLIWISIS